MDAIQATMITDLSFFQRLILKLELTG